jgi:hypothetical protein
MRSNDFDFIEEYVRKEIHIDYMLDGASKKPLIGILRDDEWVVKNLTDIFCELIAESLETGELGMGIWTIHPGDKNTVNDWPVEVEVNDDDEVWNAFVYHDTGLNFDDMTTGWTITIDPDELLSYIRDRKIDLVLA